MSEIEDHRYTLSKLKNFGFDPKLILDVGACVGKWYLFTKEIFPNAKYCLIDAIEYSTLKQLQQWHNFQFENACVDENIREINWHQMKNTGDSIYKEKTKYFDNCQIIKRTTTTLDKIFENKTEYPNLIKIDCQGAEIPILKGAKKLLETCEVIILELPLACQYNEGVPDFYEHINYMKSIDFVPFDINKMITLNDITINIDMTFIKKNHEIIKKIQNTIEKTHE